MSSGTYTRRHRICAFLRTVVDHDGAGVRGVFTPFISFRLWRLVSLERKVVNREDFGRRLWYFPVGAARYARRLQNLLRRDGHYGEDTWFWS